MSTAYGKTEQVKLFQFYRQGSEKLNSNIVLLEIMFLLMWYSK